MYEDLDKFCENLSALTIKDLVENYKTVLKQALQDGYYFIDEKSKTLCAVVRTGDKYSCLRLEGEGHRFTRSLQRQIKIVLDEFAKEGLPIEVKTKEYFYNEKVKKLLKLTGFHTVRKQDGYYISVYGDRYGN